MALKQTIKRIIHVAPDEKFIAAADFLFQQAFPNTQNLFYIITPKDTPLNYIQPKANYHIISDTSESINKLKTDINSTDLVVVHYLLDFSCKLRLATSSNICFMWLMWGKDIYESGIYNSEMYGTKTRAIFGENKGIKFAKNTAKTLLQFTGTIFPLKKKKQAIRQMQFIGIPYQEEFDIFDNANIFQKNAKPIRFLYYPLEFIFKNNFDTKVSSNNIQIGNSATATNNHLEVFDMLKNFNLEKRELIVPLSYGNQKYAKYIETKGGELFPENFRPLMDFMSLEEYQKTMQSCGIAIMNHYRQQAIGNVMSMIWMGAKVYLNERSTVYQFLNRIKCYVYSIEKELVESSLEALEILSEEKIAHNRKVLLEHYSQEKIIEYLKTDLDKFDFS